jgi:hypothetical protein
MSSSAPSLTGSPAGDRNSSAFRDLQPGNRGLTPLLAAGLPGRQAGLTFHLAYDYTLGFALADPTSPAEQHLRDTCRATARSLRI